MNRLFLFLVLLLFSIYVSEGAVICEGGYENCEYPVCVLWETDGTCSSFELAENGGWMYDCDICTKDFEKNVDCNHGVQCDYWGNICLYGVCCPSDGCIYEGDCYEEGQTRDDGVVCENGNWQASDGTECKVNTDCENNCYFDADEVGKYCCSINCVYDAQCETTGSTAFPENYCDGSSWQNQKADGESCSNGYECLNSCVSDEDGEGDTCCSTDCVYGDTCYEIGDIAADDTLQCGKSGWEDINVGFDEVCGVEENTCTTDDDCQGIVYESLSDEKHFVYDCSDEIFAAPMSDLVAGKSYVISLGEWDEDSSDGSEIIECLGEKCVESGFSKSNEWQAALGVIDFDGDTEKTNFEIRQNKNCNNWWGYCAVRISSGNADWCDTDSDSCVLDLSLLSECTKDSQCDFYGARCVPNEGASGSVCATSSCVYQGEEYYYGDTAKPDFYCDGEEWVAQYADEEICSYNFECSSDNCVPDLNNEDLFCCLTSCVYNGACYSEGDKDIIVDIPYECKDGEWVETVGIQSWSSGISLVDIGENLNPIVVAFSSTAKVIFESVIDNVFYLSKIFNIDAQNLNKLEISKNLQSPGNADAFGEDAFEVVFSENSNKIIYQHEDGTKHNVVSALQTTEPKIARNGNTALVVWEVDNSIYVSVCEGNPCSDWIYEPDDLIDRYTGEFLYLGENIRSFNLVAYETGFGIVFRDTISGVEYVRFIDIPDSTDLSTKILSNVVSSSLLLEEVSITASNQEVIIIYSAIDELYSTKQLYSIIKPFGSDWLKDSKLVTNGLFCLNNVNPSASEQTVMPAITWNIEGTDNVIFESQYFTSSVNPENGIWSPYKNLHQEDIDVFVKLQVDEPVSMVSCVINPVAEDCSNMVYYAEDSIIGNYYVLDVGSYDIEYTIEDRAGNQISSSKSFDVNEKSESWCV